MSQIVKIMGLLLLAVVVVTVGCAQQPQAPAETKTITVGILASLTGPLRPVGEGALCVQDYYTDLNATQGGIKYKNPKTGKDEVVNIKILMADHGWDTAKCISLYERYKASGMQLMYLNGSAAAAALYTSAARDKIPGIQVVSSCDPFIYELEKPYVAMDGAMMAHTEPSIVAWYADWWKKSGKTGKVKIGILAADVSTRRVLDNPELGFANYIKTVLANDVEYLGVSFFPAAPVDSKAELTKFIEKGVDILIVEHWGSGATRVVVSDAIALGMHKKGITLAMWVPSDVPLAEPKLFDEYNSSALVESMTHGWCGNEAPEIQAKYPGLKKAFDLCAKYHNGQKPEERSGWFYVYGAEYGMIGEQIIKKTLEKTGYANFKTTELRDQLFGMAPIDTQGLLPTFTPPKDVFTTWPCFKIVQIKNGHLIADDNTPWVTMGATKVYPTYKVTYTPEYQNKTWTAPSWKGQ